jgi:hypothetical protein
LLLKIVLLIGINLFTACGSVKTSSPNYTVLGENKLPDELRETSGLYCPEVGSAYTVNDSGNTPIIYNIDTTGRVIAQKTVSTKNIDWEALTGDSQHFYIGDVGNNNGKRKLVQIHTVPKQQVKDQNAVTTTEIFYKNNTVNQNEYLKHDFDAESLINVDENLFLLSKSWDTGTLFIYQLNKTEPQQTVEPVSKIEGLLGVVTGGDFDSINNRFILIGYELGRLGSFYPFITILNKDWSFNKSFRLKGYGQVEGLCVTPNAEVWFTQEESFYSTHKIVRLSIND